MLSLICKICGELEAHIVWKCAGATVCPLFVDTAEMDARAMVPPDNHFDTVVAMYLVTVDPIPNR